MQTLVQRGCGLNVHQATVVACLLRRPTAITEVCASFRTTSLAVVSPRAYPTAEELGSDRRDYGRLGGDSEIERDSQILF